MLRYLEERINAMIGIWGLDGAMAAEAAETRAVESDKALLNGPAQAGAGARSGRRRHGDGAGGAAEARRAAARGAVRAMPTREAYQPAPPLQPADDIAAPETVMSAKSTAGARPQTRYPMPSREDAATAVIEARRVEARPVEALAPIMALLSARKRRSRCLA